MDDIKISDPSKWDIRLLKLACEIARWSEDRSRKVGALIVGEHHEIRATGYNGLPRGVDASVDIRHSRDGGEKYLWFEHAERNAIFNAARVGTPLSGCTMYVTVFPCSDCARAIIQSGIIELVTAAPTMDSAFFARSTAVAFEMLQEAGVQCRFIDVRALRSAV